MSPRPLSAGTTILLASLCGAPALGESPEVELQEMRAWVRSQPQTFENALYFQVERGEIVRADRFTGTSDLVGDFDGDGDIDLYDYLALQICLSLLGPGVAAPPACLVFDADEDGDVDVSDYAAFAAALTGSLSQVRVEAGELVPVLSSLFGYRSGEPGTAGNNALNGTAAQAGYTQDDLWYQWSVLSQPGGSGGVLIANAARPASAYTVLVPFAAGEYVFELRVTNLITVEFGADTVTLRAVTCEEFTCDDGDPCTFDSCFTLGCLHSPRFCPPGESCDPLTGQCLPFCFMDADCSDDGLFCTGTETCNTDAGFCESSGDPCDPAAEACNEDTDTCEFVCADDADCDDGAFCNGAETCVDARCVDGTAECPEDGTFCNGVEVCNEDTDGCDSPGDPCVDLGQICDEPTGTCIEGVPCTTDAECDDDGLFCTGTEFCNTDTNICDQTGDPCTAPDTCNEGLNQCDAPPGVDINFTLGVDNLSGTEGEDSFLAPLEFNAPTGTSIPTFQTSDAANGGDSNDSLTAFTNLGGAATITTTLTSIETLNFTDLGTAATTMSGTNWTGVTAVNNLNSTNTNALIITGLKSIPAVGLNNTTAGMNVGMNTAATSGASDSMSLTATNENDAEGTCAGGANANEPCLFDADCPGSNCANEQLTTVTITSATTNGLESLNVASSGTSNSVSQITQVNGTTLTTVNFSGSAPLVISGAFDNSVTTFNACGSGATCSNTGGVDLTVGNGTLSFTGGDGNDTIRFSGADFTSADTINGGGGSNTLSLLSADADNAAAALTNVSNLSGLTVSDELAGAVNATFYGTITTINLPQGSNNGSLTVASGTTINVGNRGANDDSAGTFGVTIGGLATTDTLTLNVNDSDFGGAVTFTGVETLNLNSLLDLDGSAADGGVNNFAGAFTMPDSPGVVVNIAGTEAVTFTGAVTARQINAAGFGHDVTMTINAAGSTATSTVATGGVTITSDLGNDTLVGSTSTDSISAGTGNDVVQPGRGIDSISMGTGSDILDLEDLAAAQLTAANRVTVTGMTIDGTAFTGTNEVDALRFGDVTTAGNLSNGGSPFELQSEAVATAFLQFFVSTAVLELAWEFSPGVNLGAGGANQLNGTDLLSACGATTGTTPCTIEVATDQDSQIIIVYQDGNAYVYSAVESNDVGLSLAAADIALISIINGGVTVGGFVYTNFQP